MGDKLAENVIILDIRPVSIITDFFVIGTAENTRQMSAIVNAVEERFFKEARRKPTAVDGTPDSGWVLVDFGDVIMHVFDPEHRQFYDLEGLWQKAPLVARMA